MDLANIKSSIARLPSDEWQELAKWLEFHRKERTAGGSGTLRRATLNPALVNRKLLPGFKLERIPMGWKGKFPGAPQLFGRSVLLIAETEADPDFSKQPSPLSALQAALVQKVGRGLSSVLRRARKEIAGIGIDEPEDGGKLLLNVYVWLHFKNDDGKSWELVVERADGSNFGYHLAYQNTKFIEVWAGD